jgi:DNA-binding Lrp family transcriptional regulator
MQTESIRALVLVDLESSDTQGILKKVRSLPRCQEANLIFGPYDLYLKLEANSKEELKSVVFDRLWNIEGVKNTLTCRIFKD